MSCNTCAAAGESFSAGLEATEATAGDVDATRRARNVVEGGRVVAGEATRPRRMKRLRRRQSAIRRARIVMSTGESTDAETTEATETTLATLMPRVMSRSVRRARIVRRRKRRKRR